MLDGVLLLPFPGRPILRALVPALALVVVLGFEFRRFGKASLSLPELFLLNILRGSAPPFMNRINDGHNGNIQLLACSESRL